MLNSTFIQLNTSGVEKVNIHAAWYGPTVFARGNAERFQMGFKSATKIILRVYS